MAHQRGLALVEAVITLPLLLFLMIAASEFTNAFVQHTTLTKAARDAARYVAEEAIDGSLTVNLTTALKNDTKRLLVYGNTGGNGAPAIPGLNTGNVEVNSVGANVVEVTVNYPYTGILGSVLPTFGFGSDISMLFNLQATVAMRAL
ncbi:MAG: pilus assembly protein [Woeseiaceae bacterium]|nr:pilus assembly protein [Woeseiaceae bacterium]NNL49613.1 pilus assembly protein [Woeseiaceae bacterium]